MNSFSFKTKKSYIDGVEKALLAAQSYYHGSSILMDDASYDDLLLALIDAENKNPDWISEMSPVGKVAAGLNNSSANVTHTVPMLSLDNVFSKEELVAWDGKLERVLERKASSYVVEPKLDGLAISAIFRGGELIQALTRGDGLTGEDVTKQVKLGVQGLPIKLNNSIDIEIRGEILMTDVDFLKANEIRAKLDAKPLVNPRNGAAGALRAKYTEDRLPLTFFGYQIVDWGSTTIGAVEEMKSLGINTALDSKINIAQCATIEEVYIYIEKLAKMRDTLGFGIDGAVVKANIAAERDSAGFTTRSPRWAIAYKYPSDMRLTKLLAIDLQIGRTGAITPVGRVEPVFVGGTTISSVTLHNHEEITRKDIMINDQVWVRRAGEVIPEIVSVETSLRPVEAYSFVMPTACPNCKGNLDQSNQVWRCLNKQCTLFPSLEYFVSRECMDIEGLGKKHILGLIEAGLITDIASLYFISKEQLLTLDRMAELSVNNIYTQIQGSKSLPLHRFLAALGIKLTGRRASKKIAQKFLSLDSLLNASISELAQVDGIGEIRAQSIFDELIEIRPLIERFRIAGVNFNEPVILSNNLESILLGKSVCVTGSIPGLTRSEINSKIEELGGKPSSSITKKTDFLVLGADGGSKHDKALEFGTKIITGSEFLELIK
jgi:DNA ligase (NAD+)